jgi:hypothetical protein
LTRETPMNPETASVPVSGRRRQTPSRRRSRLPRLLAAVVALAGVALVAVGALKATVWAPSATTVATLVSPGRPVVSTAVGLLGLEGPRLEVKAGSSRRPVFVGIGRAHDVDAYLGQADRLEVIGDDGHGTLLTAQVGREATLPDPAGVDVWVVSSRARGSAGLVWPDAPGQWRMVIATDGTAAAADKITLTWSGKATHTAAAQLISIGLVLIVAGLITLVLLASRARLGRA